MSLIHQQLIISQIDPKPPVNNEWWPEARTRCCKWKAFVKGDTGDDRERSESGPRHVATGVSGMIDILQIRWDLQYGYCYRGL